MPASAAPIVRRAPAGRAWQAFHVSRAPSSVARIGAPVSAMGELPDGTTLDGPGGLKQALVERQEMFVRNLAKRMLGYALGRGLTPADSCAVERIVDRAEAADHQAWELVRGVVLSDSFLERKAP